MGTLTRVWQGEARESSAGMVGYGAWEAAFPARSLAPPVDGCAPPRQVASFPLDSVGSPTMAGCVPPRGRAGKGRGGASAPVDGLAKQRRRDAARQAGGGDRAPSAHSRSVSLKFFTHLVVD
jgi:hypothetical protein